VVDVARQVAEATAIQDRVFVQDKEKRMGRPLQFARIAPVGFFPADAFATVFNDAGAGFDERCGKDAPAMNG
jgi:hypothetical protein